MSVKQAFKMIVQMQGRDMTFTRRDTVPIVGIIKAANSNYWRATVGPEEITINTNEVVAMAQDFIDAGFVKPKKGDSVVDEVFGTQQIDRVFEMMILGKLLAYRIRFR